jgi:DNA-binding NtrC family response regulator
MSQAFVLVSPDAALCEVVRSVVCVEFACEVVVVEPHLVLDVLRHQTRPQLLLDTRPENVGRATETLIKSLASRAIPALDVFSLGSAYLPVAVAAELDLLATGHINVEQAGFEEALRNCAEWFSVSKAIRPVFDSRRLDMSEVHVATYTPEFFPVVDDLIRVAGRDVTLLLVGETGTGKTTLARLVHEMSPRKNRQFQHLACGALPADLIESELFGHTRGAFTGADRTKIGRFEAAGHGTLLLDEIDVLDMKQQTKLLKVIETGEYEMVGSAEPRKSNARLIVASNVNLKELTEQNRFRSDLYYRLNVLEFRLPALRERPLDIAFLALQFIKELCVEHAISIQRIHRDFLDALRRYPWPGNLREMKNHMRRAVLFCHDGDLNVTDLSLMLIKAQFAPANGAKSEVAAWTLAQKVAQSERELLEDALKANDNNRTKTARALGISRVGLYKKMQRLGMMAKTGVQID